MWTEYFFGFFRGFMAVGKCIDQPVKGNALLNAF
jgi:hypothetical protein